jgi:hypothetical protein
MRTRSPLPSRRRRASFAVLAGALIAVAGCAKEPPPNAYPDDLVANFMTGCRQRASQAICDCGLGKIQRRWTADQFRELDKTMGEAAAAQIAETVAPCAGR